MNRRTATALAGMAAVVAIALSACTPTEPTPTPTPKPTVSPTPTTPSTPTPAPVASPANADEAVASANKTYIAYLDASMPFRMDLSLGPEYLSEYVLEGSQAWKSLEDTVAQQKTSPVISGSFSWRINDQMSYAGPATETKSGTKMPYGSVILYGCLDNTKVKFSNPDVPSRVSPFEVQMVFDPARKVWLITKDHGMRESEGKVMPQC